MNLVTNANEVIKCIQHRVVRGSGGVLSPGGIPHREPKWPATPEVSISNSSPLLGGPLQTIPRPWGLPLELFIVRDTHVSDRKLAITG